MSRCISWSYFFHHEYQMTGSRGLCLPLYASPHGHPSLLLMLAFLVRCTVLLLAMLGATSAYTKYDVRRPKECYSIAYPHSLPSLSVRRLRGSLFVASVLTRKGMMQVVITALDEDPKLLEDTVRSILKHTPGYLLKDIIIVDDASRDQPVRRYMTRTYHKVVVVYNKGRGLGVAGARMAGADKATGDVIIFLDSHMEVTERWAEPFLLHLQNHPDSIASAVIEAIDPDTKRWESMHPSLHLVTLRVRDLEFKWSGSPPPENVTAAPIETASILGSAFGISRKFWQRVGRYDPGLEIWGVENIEIAAKAWMCGSGAYVLPCSRIGHIYWKGDKRTRGAYRFEDTTFVARNKARFAQVSCPDDVSVQKGQVRSLGMCSTTGMDGLLRRRSHKRPGRVVRYLGVPVAKAAGSGRTSRSERELKLQVFPLVRRSVCKRNLQRR